MNGDVPSRVEELLDRLHAGDRGARGELLDATYRRLERLARKMFRRDFPRLRGRHDTTSVLHQGIQRMLHALDDDFTPTSTVHYFRFAAVKMRQTLLDLSRQVQRRPAADPLSGSHLCGAALLDAEDSGEVAQWAEFHERVQELPEEERQVMDLHYYHGLSQERTAAVLGVSQATVHRLWKQALLRLRPWVPGVEDRGPGG